MKRIFLAVLVLAFATLACEGGASTPFPAPEISIFDAGRTVYGFFPSPPEVSFESILKLYEDFGDHADFVLIQQNAAWEDFVNGADGESQTRADLTNQVKLARQNGLEYIFVLDALNGLNRREFAGLPAGWEASFANPNVRAAYKNYALWVVRQFRPRYLGLASEINTYMDAHPDDAPNFVSLYNEIYGTVKAEAPGTQIFVTFQWEDLNNMFPQPEEGNRQRFDTNWEQIEAFEPNLDVWAISSYPFVAFPSGADIPADYYTPLLARTSKPVAVAEGGFTSRPNPPLPGDEQSQVDYLNAIHEQFGPRLTFWVYLLLNDFNIDSYAQVMRQQGLSEENIHTLGFFASVGLRQYDGTPKPALEIWDSFRTSQ